MDLNPWPLGDESNELPPSIQTSVCKLDSPGPRWPLVAALPGNLPTCLQLLSTGDIFPSSSSSSRSLVRVRVNSFKLSENMLVADVSIAIAVIYLIVGNFIPTVDNLSRRQNLVTKCPLRIHSLEGLTSFLRKKTEPPHPTEHLETFRENRFRRRSFSVSIAAEIE